MRKLEIGTKSTTRDNQISKRCWWRKVKSCSKSSKSSRRKDKCELWRITWVLRIRTKTRWDIWTTGSVKTSKFLAKISSFSRAKMTISKTRDWRRHTKLSKRRASLWPYQMSFRVCSAPPDYWVIATCWGVPRLRRLGVQILINKIWIRATIRYHILIIRAARSWAIRSGIPTRIRIAVSSHNWRAEWKRCSRRSIKINWLILLSKLLQD